jgi:DNA-binding LacI/PurR family transcriptional regulator
MLQCGCRRILFFARPNSAPTVKQRILGYREALRAYSNSYADEPIEYCDPGDLTRIRTILSHRRPDAIICANDFTAAKLMSALNALGVSIPSQVKIAGMDDVKYASLLQVPLTTVHQPCSEIGITALRAMLDRVAHPEAPARDFWVNFHLVVRNSTGPVPSATSHNRKLERKSAD